MSKINVLGFDIANLIAAGEVVDRPASVVKELMENAIDAGARTLSVEIKAGGTTLIRVTDDGCGIEKDELPVAILRHATSKIHDVTDLAQIMTLGFRGEALAAISSVSRMRITSKIPGAPLGATMIAEYGEVIDLADAGCPDGTTVVCESLFANVPARRKFLKKDSTETAAVTAVVEKIALSSPQIAIRYITDGETRFQTPGNSDLTGVIYVIYGRDVASRLRQIGRSEGGLCVEGFVSEPDFYRPNRNMMNFFINHRYVKSRTMGAAVEQAYATHIPSDKFPFCIINFTVNPQAVDVNVHPSKLEVKFTNERLVFDAVYYAVLNALERETSRPELSLGKESTSKADSGGAERRFPSGTSGTTRRSGMTPVTPADKTGGGFWVSGERASKLLSSFVSGDSAERGTQLRLGDQGYVNNGEGQRGAGDERIAYGSTQTSAVSDRISIQASERGDKTETENKTEEVSHVSPSDVGVQGAAPSDIFAKEQAETENQGLVQLSSEDRLRYMDIVSNAPYPIDEASAEYSLKWVAEKYDDINASDMLRNEPLPDVSCMLGKKYQESKDNGGHESDMTTKVEVSRPNETDVEERAMPPEPPVSPTPPDMSSHPEFAVDSAADDDSVPQIPEYTILGEAFNCYIIVQLEDRLVLIDKHAAHERIIFDSLVEKMKRREKHGQALMFPIEVTLTDAEKDALREYEERIRSLGFDFSFSDGGIAITVIPEELSRESAADMIVDLAAALGENIGTIESVGYEYFEARLYQASCKAAIKGGRVYARDNLRYICDRLLRQPKPGESAISTCPHGRPVAFEIKRNSIERQFQRLI